MWLVSNKIKPADNRATLADTAKLSAGISKNKAASPANMAMTMPMNKKLPMKLKSLRVIST